VYRRTTYRIANITPATPPVPRYFSNTCVGVRPRSFPNTVPVSVTFVFRAIPIRPVSASVSAAVTRNTHPANIPQRTRLVSIGRPRSAFGVRDRRPRSLITFAVLTTCEYYATATPVRLNAAYTALLHFPEFPTELFIDFSRLFAPRYVPVSRFRQFRSSRYRTKEIYASEIGTILKKRCFSYWLAARGKIVAGTYRVRLLRPDSNNNNGTRSAWSPKIEIAVSLPPLHHSHAHHCGTFVDAIVIRWRAHVCVFMCV